MKLPGLILSVIILLLACSLWPGEACAARRLVAAVFTADLPRYREAHRAFVKTLAQRGFEEGDLEIIEQFPNADPISWANAVRKFVGLNADLIVAYGAPAALAASKEAAHVPVVFSDVYGPLEIGIVNSMTRSGGNLTGISSKVPLINVVRTMQGVTPLSNVGIIFSSREAGSLIQAKELRRASAQLGVSVHEFNAMSPAGFDMGLTDLLKKVDCLIVSESTVAARNFDKILRRAHEARVPVLSVTPDGGARGAIVSLEVNPSEQGQVAGEIAARVLGGAQAGTIPIAVPKRIDLLVNMKAARNYELSIPSSVQSHATRIIK